MNGNGQQSSNGPMVDAQDVHKYFHGNEVLKGINMQVAKGEVVVLIGASGSGKTTFLRCINHLEKIDKGRIYVDGELIGYQVAANGKVVEANEKETGWIRGLIEHARKRGVEIMSYADYWGRTSARSGG